MLKSRQKEITKVIKEKGFKLNEFEFTPSTNIFFTVKWKGSGFYFKTTTDGYAMSPGIKGKINEAANVGGWDANLHQMGHWLDCVLKEKEVGDPWKEDDDEFQFYQEINEEYADGETSFTESEIKNITVCLAEIKQHLLSNAKLSEQQVNAIQGDIKRLEANGSKISAKDWYLLFGGLLLSWVAGGILTPDQPKILFDKLMESVAGGMSAAFKFLG